MDFEREILLQLSQNLDHVDVQDTYIFDDHDEEGQFDTKSLVGIGRAGDIISRDVRAHDLEHRRLDIGISDTLDVTVADALVPDLERFRTAKTVRLCLGRTRVELTRLSTRWRGTHSGKCF